MNISLPPELQSRLQDAVKSGLYSSEEEVIGDALRRLLASDFYNPQYDAPLGPPEYIDFLKQTFDIAEKEANAGKFAGPLDKVMDDIDRELADEGL